MLEDRVARLEENLFFQERLVNDLNAALTAQQRQLDAMERLVGRMSGQLEEMRFLLEEGGGGANTPPPHYSRTD